jgi:fucose 4-O-acetylase-like acetyltransferase
MRVQTEKKSMNKKIWYLDNIRLILAIFVVAWHSANAYIGIANWPVSEKSTSVVINGLKTFFDAITMPLFFYISGYFAFTSIRKHASKLFIKAKIKTILIPWILVILLITPFIEMIGRISQHQLDIGYFELWKWQINRILQFDFGIITDGFYQRYMWFLSLLFTFFVILAIFYKANNKWFYKNTTYLLNKKYTASAILKFVIKVACLTLFIMTSILLSILIFTKSSDPEPFVSVFNIIQFQATRLPIYIVYFVLGLLTYRNHWFERDFLKNRKLWNILFIITGVFYISITNIFVNLIPLEIYGFLFLISINFFIISTLGFALTNAKKYLDKPLFGAEELTSHAFNIYIIHYIYVHVLQLAFLNFGFIPLLIKFVFVTIISILLSFVTSRYLMKPYPKITIAIGISLTIIMFIIT